MNNRRGGPKVAKDPWLSLIENAEMQMLMYDYHKRSDLQQRGRELPCYIVSYIKSGSSRLRLGDKDYCARAGDVLFIPANVRHDHVKDTAEETEFLWWHFNLRIAGAIDALAPFQFPVCFRLSESDRFERVFHEYLRCAAANRSVADVLMKSAKSIELIALLISEALGHPDIRVKPAFSNTFADILSDIVGDPARHVSLEQLGKQYHLHPTYISNQFKKTFGITPIQLQKQVSLDKAKKLLETGSYTIGEVGELVGYEDLDDFSRFFKSKTGLSPQHYRNQLFGANSKK